MTFPKIDKTEVFAPTGAAVTSLRAHPDALLTSVELARTLKVNDRLPEVWRATGMGPVYIRAGGRRVLYRWADVMQWLATRRFTSTAEEASAT